MSWRTWPSRCRSRRGRAGFVIDRIAEPRPAAEALGRYPDDLAQIVGVPIFIVYRLRLAA